MATYFPMQGGRIKIQAETLLGQNPAGASAGWIWQATGEGNNTGSQGSGYYYFKSETLDGSVKTPNQGVFSAAIEVPESGYYNIRLRAARDTNDPGDSRNDIWLKVDDNIRDHLPEGTVPLSITGGFVKLKGANTGWTFANKFSAALEEDANANSMVWLDAGSHTITFAGRSVGYHIDFFEVIRQGVRVPTDAPDTPMVNGPAPEPEPEPEPVAQGPVAVDDLASTDIGIPVAIDVLANDTDADGDRVGYRGFVGVTAQGGTVDRVGMKLVYTPPEGFTGTDSFTYVALDSTGLASNRAQVTIEVRDPDASAPLTVGLYDAATDKLVATLANGATFIGDAISDDSTFAVEIDPDGVLAGQVGSVKLTLSGDASATRTESGAPYSLFGDKDGDLKSGGLDLEPGTYHFRAEAFSGAKGTGTLVDTFDFNFTVAAAAAAEPAPEDPVEVPADAPDAIIVGLYDSTSDALVATLADGAALDAGALGANRTFAVEVDPNGDLAGQVGSVKLTLSGDASATRTESGAPYSLFGDKDGDLKGGITLEAGNYHFEVDVFAGAKGKGELLDTFAYDFSISDGDILLV